MHDRLWRLHGLQVPRKQPPRCVAASRPRPLPATGANQMWAYDFVFDAYATCQQFKCLTVVDEYTRECLVHRDLNRDFGRVGGKMFEGVFGLNQHCGFNRKKKDIGRASAGCQLGRTKSGHSDFMRLCKDDPRYVAKTATNSSPRSLHPETLRA